MVAYGFGIVVGVGAVVSVVLDEYYRVTGRRVLRDRGLENVTVTIAARWRRVSASSNCVFSGTSARAAAIGVSSPKTLTA